MASLKVLRVTWQLVASPLWYGTPMQLVEPHATQRQLVTHGGACSSFFGSVPNRPPWLVTCLTALGGP